MKKWVDKRRRSKEYKAGEKVLVRLLPNQFKYLRTVHKGLVQRYEGPFSILERVGKAAYRLELPSKLKSHNVFHVSMLKPFPEDIGDLSVTETTNAPRGVVTKFDKKIKEILAERKIRKRVVPNYIEYLIVWEEATITDDKLDDEQDTSTPNKRYGKSCPCPKPLQTHLEASKPFHDSQEGSYVSHDPRCLKRAKEFEVRTLTSKLGAKDAYLTGTEIGDAHL
ncbi:hypothetical protein E6C27_scaffold103G00400 [Cucumis melo var. makuwa]|uniref:Tf2-1-like SH3-like domain-containing protein n=1 Tax=Cucumis melo var. makuwa TaxID=1194695 RepID=A0A5A7SVB4_CUCMM|nr:hypothetical protein E6C27_scaffold103G00400 [Cucumis melo var. makuwa]